MGSQQVPSSPRLVIHIDPLIQVHKLESFREAHVPCGIRSSRTAWNQALTAHQKYCWPLGLCRNMWQRLSLTPAWFQNGSFGERRMNLQSLWSMNASQHHCQWTQADASHVGGSPKSPGPNDTEGPPPQTLAGVSHLPTTSPPRRSGAQTQNMKCPDQSGPSRPHQLRSQVLRNPALQAHTHHQQRGGRCHWQQPLPPLGGVQPSVQASTSEQTANQHQEVEQHAGKLLVVPLFEGLISYRKNRWRKRKQFCSKSIFVGN